MEILAFFTQKKGDHVQNQKLHTQILAGHPFKTKYAKPNFANFQRQIDHLENLCLLKLDILHDFEVSLNLILHQIPDSRLGRLAQCESELEALAYCDQCNCAENEVFFNHRYQNMEDILDFYRSGTLHISTDCCPMAFVADLVYWGFQETSLEPCCLKRWLECKEQARPPQS